MFRKTETTSQLDLFTAPDNLLSTRARKKYDDKKAWHNQFFSMVTSKIDEESFRPLFEETNMGAPNASVRRLVAMNILKEGFGCSDEELFDKIQFDLLTRRALGLELLEDAAPSMDTYYLFRRRICDYERKHGVDLMANCFKQVTGEQVKLFKLSGKTVRMDSKLIGSNIAWYSRYQIIHETLCLYLKAGGIDGLNPKLRKQADEILAEDAQQIVYRSDSVDIFARMMKLGNLIHDILVRNKVQEGVLLRRVFNEQYILEKGKPMPKDKSEISADSVQNPNDPDAEYRSKNGDKVKGYSTNITETTDEPGKPSLITDVQVEGATASDNSYVQSAVEATEQITGNSVEKIITDGAYQSQGNRDYAAEHAIEYIATGIRGKEPRFEPVEDNGEIVSFIDRRTGEVLQARKTGGGKYKVKCEGKTPYRYFDRAWLDGFRRRRDFLELSQKEKNKRNNVEASIFQYCFHTRNNKTRYRGLMKHKLFSYTRCMWINARRLMIFQMKECQRTLFIVVFGNIFATFHEFERSAWKMFRKYSFFGPICNFGESGPNVHELNFTTY